MNFSKNFIVNIEPTNDLNNIKEIYYYIDISKDLLTKNELNEITEWEKYENIVEINQEGIYTIYAKIVSADNSVTYLNTDLIILDLTGANTTISPSLQDISWNKLQEELNTYYIDESINITIDGEDSLSGVK